MRSLDKLIKCAKREVAIWRNAYPKFVARGTMSKTQCMEEIDCMEDIIALLERQKLLEEVSEEMLKQKPNPHPGWVRRGDHLCAKSPMS